jgi:hypothetical protein
MTTTSNGHNTMTDEEFHRQLTQLLQTAAANDIEVRGGWACQTDGEETTAWDIESVEVAPTP